MNILLINPWSRKLESSPRFPLGLGYIASVLIEAGHRVQVIDANGLREKPEVIKQRIRKSSFDLVGITGMIVHFNQVKWLASVIREYSTAKIIVGGGLASAVPELVLRETDADICVVGEGETTIVELASAIENNRLMKDIKGLCYKDGNQVHRTPPRELIDDLSQIPFPAWDLFPMDYYVNTPTWEFSIPKMDVITSRGCPYRCNFCFHGIFGHRYRARPADDVIREILALKSRYKVHGIAFIDDLFVLDKKRVHDFCDRIIGQKIGIFWNCDGRANLMDKEMLRKMKDAGCVYISYGIESGNQKILDNINKQITIAQAKEAIKLTRECGLMPHAFMQIGLPGETTETIADSIRFCQDVGLFVEFSITTPIPGSPLCQEALNSGRLLITRDFVANWGSFFEGPVVNLTQIPDDQLTKLKRKGERSVFNHVVKRHPREVLRWLYTDAKVNGLFSLVKRLSKGSRKLAQIG